MPSTLSGLHGDRPASFLHLRPRSLVALFPRVLLPACLAGAVLLVAACGGTPASQERSDLRSPTVDHPAATGAPARAPNGYFDSFPPELAKELLAQREAEERAANKLAGTEAHYLFSKKRWPPGSRILVAFNGGTPDLHKAIAETANVWTKHANLVLDFGFDPTSGAYRSWSERDTARKAHIRIGFDEPGYWSHVGTDSVSPYVGAGEPSMNFSRFLEQWPHLMPERWKTVVVHEFGHALGLHHEHQHQACASEFRWERGPNGEPSVYDVFYSWQGWNRDVVDVNLKPMPAAKVDMTPDPDQRSIMFYAMPAQSFVRGDKSKCFLGSENAVLSASDALGAKRAYPKNPTQAVELAQTYASASAALATQSRGTLTADESAAVQFRLDAGVEAAKPLLYIHIQRESDRKQAQEIQRAGRAAGFFVPGIENVSRKGLRSGPVPQVRYFRDVDARYAQTAAKLVPDSAGRDAQVVQVKSLADSVTRNLVEIWLP